MSWLTRLIDWWETRIPPDPERASGLKITITSVGQIRVDPESLVRSEEFKRQAEACGRLFGDDCVHKHPH